MPAKTPKKSSELADLKAEIKLLKKEMARMRRELDASQKPGNLVEKSIQISRLEICNAQGEIVASIDNKGNLFCSTLRASVERSKGGVFIDGAKKRKIVAGKIELQEDIEKSPVVDLSGEKAGSLCLRNLQNKQQVWLQGEGPVLIGCHEETGEPTVILSCSGTSGGHLNLRSSTKGKARAVIGISDLTQAGAILLTDEKNRTVGKIPDTPSEPSLLDTPE